MCFLIRNDFFDILVWIDYFQFLCDLFVAGVMQIS